MSKALNELKKATMASYLAKAGGRVRSGTKIGLDFEHDAYKDMAIANKHHPNMVTPGFEKDPEKLKSAETRMNTNMDLAKTFKRDAANRIKGIARAGRLLAKEEAIEEAEKKNPYGPGYKLVDKDGNELKVGHKFKHTSHHEGSKPEHHEITGWQSGEQRGNSSSSGRVAVRVGKGKKSYETEYFPHVFGMKVVKEEAEQIDELSKKTLGSYIKKAVSNIDATSWTAGGGKRGKRMTDLLDKVYKRTNNVNRAVDKLAKEEVEQVDEVSRSTIAKVATARYQQAQAALKQKDFGGYVKKMKKAIKAADATTPNTGWSPEDDNVVKREEVSPVEKYRQIKEAKFSRKGK